MRNLLLSLVSFGICILLAELGTRLLLPQPGLSLYPPNLPPEILMPDEQRSYAYRPGFDEELTSNGERFRVAINELGMRDAPVAPGDRIDILAVGDSFTAGFMVPAELAWPARLQHHLRSAGSEPALRVLNAGVSGYNAAQIRQTVERFSDLDPQLVVAGIVPTVAGRLFNPYQWFDGYAVRRNNTPYLKTTDEGFLTAIPSSVLTSETQHWLMENFYFGAWLWLTVGPLLESEAAAATNPTEAEVMTALFGELDLLRDYTRSRNIELVVMLVGYQDKDGSISNNVRRRNALVTEHCQAAGIPVLDPLGAFEAWPDQEPVFRAAPDDFHWSALGHDVAARALAEYLVETGAVRQATARSGTQAP